MDSKPTHRCQICVQKPWPPAHAVSRRLPQSGSLSYVHPAFCSVSCTNDREADEQRFFRKEDDRSSENLRYMLSSGIWYTVNGRHISKLDGCEADASGKDRIGRNLISGKEFSFGCHESAECK